MTTLPTHPHLVHPRTGAPLAAVYVTKAGRAVWPVLGGSQPAGEPAPASAPPAPATPSTSTGQPNMAPPAVWNIYTGSSPAASAPAPAPATPAQGQADAAQQGQQAPPSPGNPGMPWRELPLEDQVEYWMTRSKKHEGRQLDALGLKPGELDEMRASLARVDAVASEAEQRGRSAALAEVGSRLVDAHMRVEIGQRMGAEQVTALLSNMDLRRFQTETGEVDTAKVSQFVSTILPAAAPASTAPTGDGATAPPPAATAGAPGQPDMGAPPRQVPDMGQGDRQIARPSGLAAGREIAAQRFGAKARSAATQ